MVRKIAWLVTGIGALALAHGCGDDDGGGGGGGGGDVDAGGGGGDMVVNEDCPGNAPNPEEMYGPCCYRVKNDGDRADAPEFRLAGIAPESPAPLANPAIKGVLGGIIDMEDFNWIIRVDATDGAEVTTGYGERNDDGTFSFVTGAAPTDSGPADRWDPVTASATLEGDVLSSDTFADTVTVPAFDDEGGIILELPLRSLSVDMATLSAERSCIGDRTSRGWNTDAGSLVGYVTVEDAKTIPVTALMRTLCQVVAGLNDATCDEAPRAEWETKPDSLCEDGTCTMGECDPDTDCNAWQLQSGFAAQGVEITD